MVWRNFEVSPVNFAATNECAESFILLFTLDKTNIYEIQIETKLGFENENFNC